MKTLKENKGFTLIELLAVIVVLAIVMVLATTTVLPYMANARKESFALEANTAKDAASQAVSLILIGSVKDNYTKTSNGYCFTIKNLVDLGLFEKEDANYKGVVQVTQTNNAFTYLVKMKNSQYYVTQSSSGNVEASHVTEGTPNATQVPEACS